MIRWLKRLLARKQPNKNNQEEDTIIDWEWFDFLRGPGYAAQDERPSKEQKPEQPPLEMIEYPEGWPPPVNTD